MRFSHILPVLLLCLSACVSGPQGSPADEGFDITGYFDGRILGKGIIERNDRVLSRFDMIVDAGFDGSELTLDETFLFDNGSDFRRVWRLRKTAPGVWTGGAENVEGTTTIRIIDGVVHMHYVAAFPYNDGMISLRFNQRLIPMQDNIVLNRSRLSKFGVPVGTVTVIFEPEDAS